MTTEKLLKMDELMDLIKEKKWDKIGTLDFKISNFDRYNMNYYESNRDYIYDYHQSILKRSFNFFDDKNLYLLILSY